MTGDVLNVSEAARIAGVSRQALMKALRTGRLEGRGTSPPTMTRTALQRWLQARAGAGGSDLTGPPGVSGPPPLPPATSAVTTATAGAAAAGGVGESDPVLLQARALAAQSTSVAELLATVQRLLDDVSQARSEQASLWAQNAQLRNDNAALRAQLIADAS